MTGNVRRRPSIRLWFILVGGVLLVSSVGITSAAFIQNIRIEGEASGQIDIAQGPEESDQFPSPDDRNVIATVDDEGSTVVTTLYTEPVGDPDQATKTLPIVVQAVGDTLAANVSVQVTNAGTADEVWNALRFGLYVGDTPLLPGGVPVPATELGTAAAIDVPPAAENSAVTITLKIWLAPDAPLAAYGSIPALNIDVLGETVGGQVIDGEVRFP